MRPTALLRLASEPDAHPAADARARTALHFARHTPLTSAAPQRIADAAVARVLAAEVPWVAADKAVHGAFEPADTLFRRCLGVGSRRGKAAPVLG